MKIIYNEKHNKITNYIGIYIFRILLDYIYITILSPIYGYSGFTYSFNWTKYLLSWLILFAFSFLIVKNMNSNRPSDMVITIISLMAFLPGTSYYALYPKASNIFFVYYSFYWASLLSFNLIIPNFKKWKVLPLYISKNFTILLLAVFSLTVLYVSWKYTGFRVTFNIFDVYGLREEAREFNMPIVIKYLFSMSRAVIPTLFLYMLSKKRYFFVVFLGIVQILIFSVDGSKSVLFSLAFVIICYIVFTKNFSEKLSYYFVVLSLVAILEVLFLKGHDITNFLFRRTMFVPQQIAYQFFDFFSKNEFDYFRSGFLGRFGLESPYPLHYQNIISGVYSGNYSGNSCNGLFGDAFANMGYIGLLVMPIFIIISLRILDFASRGLSKRILVGAYVSVSLGLINNDIFIMYLTHGFLALCFVLFFLPREKSIYYEIEKKR